MKWKWNCLLGDDFLSRTDLSEKIYKIIFEGTKQTERRFCSRILKISKRISYFLEEIYENRAKDLDFLQKECFLEFLSDFAILNIKLNDPRSIKQVPRQVPFGMHEEINKIIDEMKHQGVIEESHSFLYGLS